MQNKWINYWAKVSSERGLGGDGDVGIDFLKVIIRDGAVGCVLQLQIPLGSDADY